MSLESITASFAQIAVPELLIRSEAQSEAIWTYSPPSLNYLLEFIAAYE